MGAKGVGLEQGSFAPSDGAKPTPRCMAAGLVSRSASKVNVEIADPTYLPADAAFENLEEARDDLLASSQQSIADEPFPRCSIVRVRWRGKVLSASFISTPVSTPSSSIGKASSPPYELPIPAAS